MEDKKYEIWENEDLVFATDNSEIFSLTIAVQYPLGSFIRVNDCGNRIVFTFENFWLNIYK